MAVHEGVCTCPVCCPAKWDLNLIAARNLHNQPLSQTGFSSVRPDFAALAEIMARLERIEAILAAHVRQDQPSGDK